MVGSVPFFLGVAVLFAAVALAGTPGRDYIYRSAVFLTAGALLALSLLACVIPRAVRRIRDLRRSGAPGARPAVRPAVIARIAPDIIHAGIFLLIAGGTVSFAFREQQQYVLPVGDSAVHSDLLISVRGGQEVLGADGSLRNWQIDLEVNGERVSVKTNRPGRSRGHHFHLLQFEDAATVLVTDGFGSEHTLLTGEGVVGPQTALLFAGTRNGQAVFAIVPADTADGPAEYVVVREGTGIGPLEVGPVGQISLVGIQVSRDPGRLPLGGGLVILTAGLLLYGFGRWRRHG